MVFLLGCGDSSDSKGTSDTDSETASCEYNVGGLHYCAEYRGVTSEQTGCSEGGGIAGSGCSREDVAGTCSVMQYEAFFYGSGIVESAVSAVCPGGTYVAGTPARPTTQTGCTVTLSGAYSKTHECQVLLRPNTGGSGVPFIQIQSVDGLFAFQLDGEVPPEVGTYEAATLPDNLEAFGTVWTARGAGAQTWSLGVNRPLANQGDFTFTITSIAPSGSSRKVLGTLDATYPANASSGASGEVTVELVAE